MKLRRCYRFRLEPTAAQRQDFLQFAGCQRFIWNWALERRNEAYRGGGKKLDYYALAADLPRLKQEPETAFLRDCSAAALQETLRALDRAFVSFFKNRARHPRFKSRKRTSPAFRMPQDVKIEGNRVRIPKIGLVRARIHRPVTGTIKSATIKQSPDGQWFITFVSEFEKQLAPITSDRAAGLDVGLASFATFDDGTKIAPPKFYRKQESKLKQLQRRLSRCQMRSRNRVKAKKRLTRTLRKVRDQRQDWLHKLSRRIVHEHDTLCIEDLSLKGLVKTKLAKSFSDAAHGAFAQMLTYKGLWYGCQVVKVGRFFASTRICSRCGYRQALTLSQRHWLCDQCGQRWDRDVNAAKNLLTEGLRILAAGHADSLNACGEDVRLAHQAIPVEARILPALSGEVSRLHDLEQGGKNVVETYLRLDVAAPKRIRDEAAAAREKVKEWEEKP